MAMDVHARLTAVAVAAGLCLGTAVPRGQAVFRAASDLVVLQVAVHDRRLVPVPDLTADAFRLWEDGVPQQIRFFVRDERPAAVGLVVDNSTSMLPKRHETIQAAEAFARSSHPDDQLFLVNFNERVTFGLPDDVPFTSDRALLERALATIGARGQTAMFDGILVGLDRLDQCTLDRKVLIVVSDGEDNRSRHVFSDVLDRSRRSNAVVYTVGVFDPIEGGNRKLLRRLAEDTGGLAFFPEKATDIQAAFDRISLDVRHRYTIGYVSTNTRRDGTFRRVRLEAVDRQRGRPLQVKVRRGYIAPVRD